MEINIQAIVGLINDPNGFHTTTVNFKFHLFYQFYPYDSIWGPMQEHISSPDLVNWQQLPTAFLPEKRNVFLEAPSVKKNFDVHWSYFCGRWILLQRNSIFGIQMMVLIFTSVKGILQSYQVLLLGRMISVTPKFWFMTTTMA